MGKKEYLLNIKEVFKLLLVYEILCPIFPYILLIIGCKLLGYPFSSHNPVIYSLVAISSFVLFIKWITIKYNINLRNLFTLNRFFISYIFPMIFIIFGLSIVLAEIENILISLIPVNNYWTGVFNTLLNGNSSYIAAVIVAPITEEFLFRGIILRGFLKNYSVKKSIFISALLFGLIHMNPWQFLGTFIWGIIAGWWFIKTRSIVPCILGHALNNSLSYIIPLLGINIAGYSSNSTSIEHEPILFFMLGIILLVFSVILLIKLFNKRELLTT